MDTITLQVQPRNNAVKIRKILETNLIPLEYYGKGIENKSLQVDYQTFRKTFKSAGYNTVISLDIEGGEKVNALIHEVQLHPVSDKIIHVDLMHVDMKQEIHTSIPLKFSGLAPAVKELGGILMTQLSEVAVKCKAQDLIQEIMVDLSSLSDFHTYIRVKDLIIPETLTVLTGEEDIVAHVIPPAKEEEEVAVAAPAEGAEGAGGEAKAAEGEASAGESK